ncbi:alpha/beta fold hydrolase [Nakamurella sp. YIM 132087]|uniref:Alpha/beta fold hydrolase n=1 Tax=Nakamurella alba TaxID=2665158 RepID=A0A7K1FII3_9ACTN|nr:alpha/beta hydrolase [Nakamurella alba]MTD13890.1 alpha/beta fold hydrolase [Nakamurella alba]
MDIHHEEFGPEIPGVRPLVLLHGALSGIRSSFGDYLPLLARRRRVIAVEFQGHCHTPDIDRPFTVADFAGDVLGVLDLLGVEAADMFGWSMGAAVALHLGTEHPERVGRLVLASVSADDSGLYPGLLDGIAQLEPEHLHGSEFHEDYLRTAPDPSGWAGLVRRMKVLDAHLPQWSEERIRGLAAPTMLVLADSDIIRPEHSVAMFRWLGGGVPGDLVGLPESRLAVLPGSTHTSMPQRAAWLVPMMDEFLDADRTAVSPLVA